ncbi:MAG TPA: adenylate/guanylate cyclase domain-containing protein [Gemmatirosa sp.]
MPFFLADAAGVRLTALAEGGALVVGRAAECALPLDDPTVSRRHAELIGARDHLVVHDLGSRNGTFRNGLRVQTARLRAGDTVTFGVVALRVERETSEIPVFSPPGPAVAPVAPPAAGLANVAGVAAASGVSARDAAPPSAPEVAAEPPILAERGAAAPHELTARRLALLLEAAKALGGAIDPAAVHERVVTAALRTLDADRAAVFRAVSYADDPQAATSHDAAAEVALVPAVARDRWGADLTASGAVPLPRSIARAALGRRAALLSVDAAADPRFGGQSVLRQRVRSAMCAPLLAADGAPLGALYLDSADPVRAFSEADLDFLTAFAGVAAAALENARLAERVRREAVSRENFARYFAPPVAARIAASDAPAVPGGERRTVAVLFADLRGFTRLAATMTPDDVAATLSEFLSAMVECVFRHGGTLDKFIGDCVMAQWGAPERSPDDADRALRAAVAMHESLGALNRDRTLRGRPTLRMGIGLACGEVFAGNIGSERRLEFTVIGDAVNQASRLCDTAGPGEILLSDALRRALRGTLGDAPVPLCSVLDGADHGDGDAAPAYRLDFDALAARTAVSDAARAALGETGEHATRA